ncbi:integrin-linked kinase-associated serine/threonine phosphatase 2C-like isoform X3 [Apostichopus japonicus]|uniref:integrin-linked kinase-associated serine/threonine phosphatase 2C-like isoform X3 n=1 Tax=Stichopus japonicus TaxID=307972 RepID=UPI003AB8CBEC
MKYDRRHISKRKERRGKTTTAVCHPQMDLFSDLPAPSKESDAGKPADQENVTDNKRKADEGIVESPSKKQAKEQKSKWKCLKGFLAERQGEREEMQDAHVIINDLTELFINRPSFVERLAYYAVFDGHSGARAAKHAAKCLHENIKKMFPSTKKETWEKDVKRCFIEAFKSTDEDFLKAASAQKPAWKDGSTAVCVMAVNDTLYIANVGDSRAMICRYNPDEKKHHFIPLSKEHNPIQYEERMRIQKSGGYVRDGRLMGILEVSRSLGDGRFKHCGVVCLPDVKKCQLTDHDRYILLSCDGLWTNFEPSTALEFVQKIINDGETPSDEKFEVACNKLASEAVRRGSSDNVTVILVRISQR